MYSKKMEDACGDLIKVESAAEYENGTVQVLFYGAHSSTVVDMELDAAGVKKLRKMLKRAIAHATGGA